MLCRKIFLNSKYSEEIRSSSPVYQEMYMKHAIKVNEVNKGSGNVKNIATVMFDDSFKITNFAIENELIAIITFICKKRYTK